METLWDWVVQNREWLFSGLAVALPLAILGWWFSKRPNAMSQQSGDNAVNLQAQGDITIGTDNSGIERHIRQSDIGRFLETITAHAHAYEEALTRASTLGEQGDIAQGREAMEVSAGAIGKIVTAYQAHKHLFAEEDVTRIDQLLRDAESEGDLTKLVQAVQAIHKAALVTQASEG